MGINDHTSGRNDRIEGTGDQRTSSQAGCKFDCPAFGFAAQFQCVRKSRCQNSHRLHSQQRAFHRIQSRDYCTDQRQHLNVLGRGQYLLGHTLDPNKIGLGDELACDKYSGFILQRMGASKEEAIAAIQVAGPAFGTKTHPPRHARIEAIEQGWSNFQLASGESITNPLSEEELYTHKLRFEGDDNLYYISSRNEVVWYDNYAEPIVFGKFLEADAGSYVYEITWDGNRFYVDGHAKVWNLTMCQVMMEVGEISEVE